MTTDRLIVDDMRRNGRHHNSGSSDCTVNVLVSLSQENWVCKVIQNSISCAEGLGLTTMHRTDSMIISLMIYVFSSGILTR